MNIQDCFSSLESSAKKEMLGICDDRFLSNVLSDKGAKDFQVNMNKLLLEKKIGIKEYHDAIDDLVKIAAERRREEHILKTIDNITQVKNKRVKQ